MGTSCTTWLGRRAAGLSALLAVLSFAAAPAPAQDVYRRQGPFFYSNGRETKPFKAEVTDNSITSTDGQGRTNTISWDTPPEEITVGQEVTLTIRSTSNEGAPMMGGWHVGECGARDAKFNESSVCSFKGGLRRDNYTQGRITWDFKPVYTPTFAVQAGRYDDYSGEMTVRVWWKYEWVDPKAPRVSETMMVRRLEVAQWILTESDGGAIDYSDKTFSGTVLIQDEAKSRGVEGAAVGVTLGGRAIGSGTADKDGHIAFTFTLPADTPSGVNPLPVKVTASKQGFKNLERTFTLSVKRNLLPTKVEATASSQAVRAGEEFTVTGRVFKHNRLSFNEPVPSRVRILYTETGSERVLVEMDTDAAGVFRAAVVAPPVSFASIDIEAVPRDANRFDKSECSVPFNLISPDYMRLSLLTDQAVYKPGDTVRFAGMVIGDKGPVSAEVTLRVSAKLGSALTLTTVHSSSEGRFTGEFPVSRLALPATQGSPSIILDGAYVLKASAMAIGHQLFGDALAYFIVADTAPEGTLEEFEVTAVTGRPAVRLPTLTPVMSPDSARPVVGARYTQGAVIDTPSDGALTIMLPMGNGASVRLELGPSTTVRIGTFYRAPDGRVRLRIMASEPSSLKVIATNPGGEGLPLDYQIITASAVVTSIKTEYTVRVEPDGSTRVTAQEGDVRIVPIDSSRAPLLASAGGGEAVVPMSATADQLLVSASLKTAGPTTATGPANHAPPTDAPGAPNPAEWDTHGEDGATAAVQGDTIILAVPRNSGGAAEAFMTTPLPGDFEFTADYTLDQWRVAEDAAYTLSVVVGTQPMFDERAFVRVSHCADSDERADHIRASAATDDADLEDDARATSARSARLRVVRTGDRFTFSFWDGQAWLAAGERTMAAPGGAFVGVALERQGDTDARATVRPRLDRR